MFHGVVLTIFASLFILFVLFTTDFRIRYMAPAIPPLVVLSVFGIHRVVQILYKTHGVKQKIYWAGLILLIGFTFSLNTHYIYHQFQRIQPLAYLSGQVSRDTYISHFRREHAVIQYANQILPQDARVLCLSIGDRTYYLNRAAHLAEDFYTREGGRFSKKSLLRKLHRYDTTHVIFNKVVFLNWARNLSDRDRAVFRSVLETHTDLLYEKNGVLLLALRRDRLI